MHGPLDNVQVQFVDLWKCGTSDTSADQKCPVLVNHLYLQIETQTCLKNQANKA